MTLRKIQQIIPGLPATDGAGVKLMRSLGSADHLRADPFLMLDEFSSGMKFEAAVPETLMNTRQEIEQAIRDYQSGELTKAA